MGVDLRLYVYDGEDFSHTMLDLEREPELLDNILALEKIYGRDVPPYFVTFTDGGYGHLLSTPYGKKLKYLFVSDLWPLREFIDPCCFKDKAAWAYLSELPPDTKVALYWH